MVNIGRPLFITKFIVHPFISVFANADRFSFPSDICYCFGISIDTNSCSKDL